MITLSLDYIFIVLLFQSGRGMSQKDVLMSC